MFKLLCSLLALGILAILLAGCNSPATEVPPTGPAQESGVNWEDREIFRAGLVNAEQEALTNLPFASIYYLDVRISTDFTSLQGQERVRYTNQEKEPLDVIYCQLFPNMMGGKSSVTKVSVNSHEAQPLYEEDNSTLRIPLADPLPPGQNIVIQMDFQVEIPTEASGSYGLFGYMGNILVLDGFYPAIPAYDQNGWHKGKLPPFSDTTYQDASFYVVRVTAPAALQLITSGRLVNSMEENDQQTVTIAAGPARDFYMAGSTEFTMVSEITGETRVNSYAFSTDTQAAQLALRTAVNALESYSRRFGSYPYTEFDIVSTPMQGATGIEYPGITGINIAVYDLDSEYNGQPARVMLEATVAHEVGHQWFYNVVGNDQINEPWLDEALTQYLTALYFFDSNGSQGWEGYRNSWISRWQRVDRATIPIGMPAASYQGKEYGAIVYGRGPLFIEELAQKMGQQIFDKFLRNYYQAHKWSIGTAGTFKQIAEETCSCDLSPLFNEWVNPK